MSIAPYDDGGPAFPTYPTHTPGMTLRDYLAAKAMAAILAGGSNGGQKLGPDDFPLIATLSYEAADAMLAHRKRKP